jgi:hypothetical protein
MTYRAQITVAEKIEKLKVVLAEIKSELKFRGDGSKTPALIDLSGWSVKDLKAAATKLRSRKKLLEKIPVSVRPFMIYG